MQVDDPANPADVWNTRYAGTDVYLFGEEPNDYLRAQAHLIPPGSDVLCLADGEGRNGVFLAVMISLRHQSGQGAVCTVVGGNG